MMYERIPPELDLQPSTECRLTNSRDDIRRSEKRTLEHAKEGLWNNGEIESNVWRNTHHLSCRHIRPHTKSYDKGSQTEMSLKFGEEKRERPNWFTRSEEFPMTTSSQLTSMHSTTLELPLNLITHFDLIIKISPVCLNIPLSFCKATVVLDIVIF